MEEVCIMLTEACPLRCEYCYIRRRNNPFSMTMDQIDKIIEKYDPPRIIFFGGEPLVKIDLIEQTVMKYHKKIKFEVVTSTMINFERFIELNKSYPLTNIQFSWDGFSDKNRIDAKGNTVSHKVYDHILYAIDNGLKFDIRCVIGNENVHLFEEIHKMFLDFHRKHNVSCEFVVAHRPVYSKFFLEEFEKQYIKTFTLERLYSDHLNKIIAVMNNDKNPTCDAGMYTVITPRGKVCYCTALSQDEYNFTKSELLIPCNNDDCRNCKYSCLCDGGCRYERYLEYGVKWRENYLKATCKMMKIYYETINKWINSLNHREFKELLNTIERYKIYDRNYSARL